MVLTDIAGQDVLIGALTWVVDLLTSDLAASAAVLGVAVVGLLLITGRLPIKHGLAVLLGCFVVFSASSIADGIVKSALSDGGSKPLVDLPAAAVYRPTMPKPVPYDPYAGASVPRPNVGN